MNFKVFIKRSLASLLPQSVTASSSDLQYGSKISYSQEGEDMILERFFEGKQEGFFVDVGAHHPIRFSNTYFFYLKGWRGINIDATPGSMEPFNKLRPGDTNIEIGISSHETELTYYLFDDPALNTFNKERMEHLVEETPYKLENTVSIKTKTLSQVLDENVPAKQPIDFLTIDAEGLDFDILLSNNWNKYHPSFILVEDLVGSLDDLAGSKLYNYLCPLGYKVVAKTHNTLFFRLNKE